MATLITTFRLAEDQDSKVKFRTPFSFYLEDVMMIEHYPYDCFVEHPGTKTYIYFRDGRVIIIDEPHDKMYKLLRTKDLAYATGRLPITNQQ